MGIPFHLYLRRTPDRTPEDVAGPFTAFTAARMQAEKNRREWELAEIKEQREETLRQYLMAKAKNAEDREKRLFERDMYKRDIEDAERREGVLKKSERLLDEKSPEYSPEEAQRLLDLHKLGKLQRHTPPEPQLPEQFQNDLDVILATQPRAGMVEETDDVGSLSYGVPENVGPSLPALINRATTEARGREREAILAGYRGTPQGAALKEHLRAVEQHPARVAEAEAAPKYRVVGGPVEGAVLDPNRERQVSEFYNTSASRLREFAESEIDPLIRQDIQAVISGVATRQITPDKAWSQIMEFYKQRGMNERAEYAAQAAMGRARMAAGRAGIGEARSIRRETREDVNKWLQSKGLKSAGELQTELSNLVNQVASDNPQVQQVGLVTLARMAQKDPRFSDYDYQIYVQNVGSLRDALETAVTKGLTGKYGENRMEIAQTAADLLTSLNNERLAQAAQEAQGEFFGLGIYDEPVADAVLSQRLAGSYKRQAPHGAKPRKGAVALPTPGRAARMNTKKRSLTNVRSEDL